MKNVMKKVLDDEFLEVSFFKDEKLIKISIHRQGGGRKSYHSIRIRMEDE